MFKVIFYKTENGVEPARDFVDGIRTGGGKNSRINFSKINDYIKILEYKGLGANLPFIKHIEGDIWELRPLKNRIFFGAWLGDTFVLLHGFRKKSNKTPKREIILAVQEFNDFKRRNMI